MWLGLAGQDLLVLILSVIKTYIYIYIYIYICVCVCVSAIVHSIFSSTFCMPIAQMVWMVVWLWYCMLTLKLLQKILNFSETMFVSASDPILLDSPYSETCIFFLGFVCWSPLPVTWTGICCGNLQYKDNACY